MSKEIWHFSQLGMLHNVMWRRQMLSSRSLVADARRLWQEKSGIQAYITIILETQILELITFSVEVMPGDFSRLGALGNRFVYYLKQLLLLLRL